MNDTRSQNRRPFASSMFGGLHIRVFGDTRSAYEGGLFIDNVRAL